MTFLLIVVKRSSCVYSFVLFVFFLSSEDLLVSLNDALEVCVEGEEDCWLEEHFEEVIFLLELLVLVFWYSISNEDLVSLVDGGVVDHIPESNQEDRGEGKDDCGSQLSSALHVVLDEPVDEETGGNVKWHEEDDGHDWEPPLNLIVQDEEEVPGDVVEGEKHGKGSNNLHTALYWAAAAACLVLSDCILAYAEAAAASF